MTRADSRTLFPKPKSPSIWYLLPNVELGGSEKHVIRLASELRRRGYETGIACVFREGALAEETRSDGVPLVTLSVNEGCWNVGTFFRIFCWLRSNQIDILHTYLFGFHLFAGLSARLLGIPVILSSRREIADWKKKRHLWLENLGNLFVDRVVTCSRAVEKWALGRERISQEKVLTIHNGVDLERFGSQGDGSKIRNEFSIPEGAPLIGTVANLAVEKGYPYLLEAVEFVLKEKPDTWFIFVGSGPLESEIKERAAKIPGHRQIIFTGFRSDIPDFLAAMDVFVLASLIEGFPNVLLEAMAMAKPVVATEVGGIPELVDSEESGVLVPAKDGKALAKAILSLLADRGRANRLGLRAQEKTRIEFALEHMVDQYEALYLSLLREKGIEIAGPVSVTP